MHYLLRFVPDHGRLAHYTNTNRRCYMATKKASAAADQPTDTCASCKLFVPTHWSASGGESVPVAGECHCGPDGHNVNATYWCSEYKK